jgi:hypothetical protein
MNHIRTTFLLLMVVSTGSSQSSLKPTLYIPHTHWEGAVFNTREEDLEFGSTTYATRWR